VKSKVQNQFMFDVLSENKIKSAIKTNLFGNKIYAFWSVSSTNDFAYRLAMQGEDEGALVIAEQQKRGRGRQARVWDSQFGKGLWFSIIMRPDLPSSKSGLIPFLAGLSVLIAVQNITGLHLDLKWPNDIIINKKKCCGILSEVNFNNSKIDFIILGIGINVNHNHGDWHEQVNKVATSLRIEKKERINRSELLNEVLCQLELHYEDVKKNGFDGILDQWKKNCSNFKKTITVVQEDTEISGTFFDLDEKGCLLMEVKDGKTIKIVAGDVLI
jgi:BirA family transcriptional regulator, biotin operon repressor / biotin---[acetyl-CoA-carboxylase] ligase